ncbi:MAG TPA: 3,4-dihydroxy-2-butanone-4-phosphate synthase [Kineosporiaceae bacterium]|nr:3,4-dihydroxy-2-butanone-4-phosphate synthase [Kineosporiaceae bacterium]
MTATMPDRAVPVPVSAFPSASASLSASGSGSARRGTRLDTVEDAVAALRRGLPVIVVDDDDRENEGDVIMAAVNATPAWIGWTVRHTSGVLCAPMPAALADALELPAMVARNEDARGTAYTVSVDARHGVGTGISATDRATTARLLADSATGPGDLVRPGHMFPLRARDGGVLERPGHTEAAVDLCRLAGLPPVGVISELVEDDGAVMRLPAMRVLADSRQLPVISVADLAEHRRRLAGVATLRPVVLPQPRVQRVATTTLPTRHGVLTAIGYRDLATGDEHVALVHGTPTAGALVRVHSECLTGDVFGSQRCDCGPQLDAALAAIAAQGGVVVYVRGHEGRGIGLLAKLNAYSLQDAGLDTVAANLEQGLPADAREYGAAAAVLAELGLHDVRLLTNNPAKVTGLTEHGVLVRERVPLMVGAGPANEAYLTAKRELMGHLFEVVSRDPHGPHDPHGPRDPYGPRESGGSYGSRVVHESIETDAEDRR